PAAAGPRPLAGGEQPAFREGPLVGRGPPLQHPAGVGGALSGAAQCGADGPARGLALRRGSAVAGAGGRTRLGSGRGPQGHRCSALVTLQSSWAWPARHSAALLRVYNADRRRRPVPVALPLATPIIEPGARPHARDHAVVVEVV